MRPLQFSIPMCTPIYLLFILLLFCFFPENSTHPLHCPPTKFSCGHNTYNVSSPFYTDSAKNNSGCPKVHRISCQNEFPVINFFGTGFVYLVRNISLPDRTIVVHDLNLNSESWESNCAFLYDFKRPIPAINLTGLTMRTKETLSSFNCDKIGSDGNRDIFGGYLGHVSCKNYTLFLPRNSQKHPAYCSSSGDLWFTWKLSFGGDHEDRNDGGISLLSGGFSQNWDLHPDCFGCNVTATGNCTSRGDPGNPNSPCQCTKRCQDDGKGGSPGSQNNGKGGMKKRKKWVIIGVSGGAAAGLLLSILCILAHRQRRRENHSFSNSHLIRDFPSDPHYTSSQLRSADCKTHIFSYTELNEATDGFSPSQELGDGGFGTVYKGKLRDGRIVAVKRLYENNYKRVEQFMNEIDILSPLRHQNLVSLYGCTSCHCRELLLVYEFVSNGTVADHLHGPRACERVLTWPIRMRIAIETAEALGYLHAVDPPIIHRDVKTNNILLDADFHVKVADFGLSRLFPTNATHVSTAPQGTPGYVDPEYHMCFQLTNKSDVYSFGVVLAELISSKPAVDLGRCRNDINLANMAINKIQRSELAQLVDLTLGYDSDWLIRKMITMVAELALRCLQHDGDMRPPIKEVLEVLRAIEDCADKGGKDEEVDVCVMDDAGLLKNSAAFSPDYVTHKWASRSTTPNTNLRSRILRAANKNLSIKGLACGHLEDKVTFLQFADDILVFCEDDAVQISFVKMLMKGFELASGPNKLNYIC